MKDYQSFLKAIRSAKSEDDLEAIQSKLDDSRALSSMEWKALAWDIQDRTREIWEDLFESEDGGAA